MTRKRPPRITNYAKVPKKCPKLCAKAIRERDGNRCQYTGDKTRLEEEVKAIIATPSAFTEDSLRGELAKALLSAPPPPRSEPIKYRQWGEGLEHEVVSLEEAERWVLGLGTHATVIRPEKLREWLSRATEELRRRYGGPMVLHDA